MLKFEKFPGFPMGEFDGFDDATGYQMVPVRERRELGVVTGNEALLLRSRDPAIAEFANFRTDSGPLPGPGKVFSEFTLPARSRVAFSLMGVSAGPTEVELIGADGNVKALLLVSVKEKRRRVYNLCHIRDIRRATTRTQADATENMRRVEAVYLQQCNFALALDKPPADVVVPRDLGNPVRIDRRDVLDAILEATPAPLYANDPIIIYSVWDASDHRPSVGITTGRFCFIDDLQTSKKEAALTFGHEVGHALGLNHTGKHLLMAGDGVSRSSKLSQFEIDTVNQSGLRS